MTISQRWTKGLGLQGEDPNFPNCSRSLISSVRCMVVHGWGAKLHQQQGPVPGGSSSRSPVGTCFPEEPLWEQRFRRSDSWTAKRRVCTVRNTVGFQNWIALLMTEGISIASLNVHIHMEKRHGGLSLWSPGLRRITRGSMYFTWAGSV